MSDLQDTIYVSVPGVIDNVLTPSLVYYQRFSTIMAWLPSELLKTGGAGACMSTGIFARQKRWKDQHTSSWGRVARDVRATTLHVNAHPPYVFVRRD